VFFCCHLLFTNNFHTLFYKKFSSSSEQQLSPLSKQNCRIGSIRFPLYLADNRSMIFQALPNNVQQHYISHDKADNKQDEYSAR
jgi:hypothetical protein